MSEYAIDAGELPVLWMDDRPNAIRNFAKVLQLERVPIQIEFAESIDDARRRLATNTYGAMVVDCKMDDFDATLNGAEFLLEVNEADKCLPTFVYSAFVGDPAYKPHIERSYVRRVETKVDSFGAPLSKQPFFQQLLRDAALYLKFRDIRPEAISFQDFVAAPATFASVTGVHWDKHGHWISREMVLAKAVWCVVCGEDIVASSNDILEFPDETELRAIGEKMNLIPFAYTAAIVPEETVIVTADSSGWNSLADVTDAYPTLGIRIGDMAVIDDFDTGAYQTHASASLVKKGWLDFLRSNDHLGEVYRFFSKKIEITVRDAHGEERTEKLAVSFVENWSRSPFTSVNPKRQVLIGRDLLRAFRVEVVLDSLARQTRVRHL